LYLKGMRTAGRGTAGIPDLHVFIVIPEPERDQFVPRTYDTVAELGEGETSFPTYDKAVQKRREQDIQQGDSWTTMGGKVLDKFSPKTIVKRHIIDADIEESAERTPVSAAALKAMGIKVLVAKLYTQGEKGQCREIYIHSKLMIVDDAFFT